MQCIEKKVIKTFNRTVGDLDDSCLVCLCFEYNKVYISFLIAIICDTMAYGLMFVVGNEFKN